jgi:tRNA threonylcarbamoyladenosine dehydratase
MQLPIILKEGQFTAADIEDLRSKHKIWQEIDIYTQQLFELFEVEQPGYASNNENASHYIDKQPKGELAGAWIYYPWSGVLLHCLGEKLLFTLRTNRNQNLITFEEQGSLYNICVGIFGLSVGNNIALTLAYSGMAQNFKLAEFDELSTANLNRLRAGIYQVGMPKLSIATQQIYEINPYAQISVFEKGVDDSNINQFFSDPVPSVVFDEMDDFQMKIKLRIKARDCGVPVIMLTSLGDNILVDIERYDLDKSLELFNGLLGSTPEEILHAKIGEKEKVKYAIDLVGVKYIPARALESLFEINNSLVGRPQLASTIAIDGGIAAYMVRRLILGNDLPSGRYYLSFEGALGLSPTEDSVRKSEAVMRLNKVLGR